MHGVDLYMNSHFDVWIVDIDQWRPGPIDQENWRVPEFCHQGEFEELQRHQLDSSLAMEVAKQLPNLHFGELAYVQGQETYLAQANSSCPFLVLVSLHVSKVKSSLGFSKQQLSERGGQWPHL